jgi:DNA invertase Pin-like site-specific DNA recombinase
MAKKDIVREIEAKHGDLEKVIPDLVNAGGQARAATFLNTTQSTISNWLKKHGYVKTTVWKKG